MNKLFLTQAETKIVEKVIKKGLRRRTHKWHVLRLALAASLQIADPPGDEFSRPKSSGQGDEIHAEQYIGEGKPHPEDLTDVFCAILSIYDNKDYFHDLSGFEELLFRHIRRGLKEIDTTWKDNFDFQDYLLQEMYFDRGNDRNESVSAESSTLRDRIVRVLGQIGVSAELQDHHDGPRLTRVTLELHQLDDLDRLKKGLAKLAFALGLGEDAVSLTLAGGERRVSLDVPRPMATWSTVTWGDLRPALSSPMAAVMALPICVGTDVLGDPVLIDLADAPHLFIGGTTGSGKSMCLHSILLSLLEGPHQAPELILIDPKAVEFTAYSGSKAVRGGAPIIDADDAFTALDGLVAEMQSRQDKLRALDARNITEANERGAKLRRIVTVVDELGDLFFTRRDIDVPLIRLAQKARSAGIHLVLATQRPEAATFPGLLRSNVPSRIALTVQKAAESRIILDEGGAEALLMRGDMLIRFAGRQTVRAHGCRVEPADIIAAARRS